jgi:hypothetical protein
MPLTTISTVIPAGESLSIPVDYSSYTRIARILMPSEWTGGASLTFQLSVDGMKFHDLFHVSSPSYFSYEVEVARPPLGAAIMLPPGMGTSVPFMRVRSGTRGLPVVQEADRPFVFLVEMPAGTRLAELDHAVAP